MRKGKNDCMMWAEVEGKESVTWVARKRRKDEVFV